MNIKEIMNSPALWVASSLMILVIMFQSIWYFRLAKKEAVRLQIPNENIKRGLNAAMITAIGPSLALIVVLISVITIVGTPTTWMRLNDIGAGRSEISAITLACNLIGVTPGGEGFGIDAFALALWSMALNNFGWLFVTLIFTSRMNKIVVKMNEKYEPKWTKSLMNGTTLGIFGYLFINCMWGKVTNIYPLLAAVLSVVSILLINRFFKNPRMQELSLGIAMLIGMFGSTAVQYVIG